MKTVIRRLDHKNSYGIWLYNMVPNSNTMHIAKPRVLEFTEVPDGFMLPEPTLEIRADMAQEFFQGLVNGLVEQGVRPNNDKLVGELEATKLHLKDLQKYIDFLLTTMPE